MNILFDESVHVGFQKDFARLHIRHTVSNVTMMKWSAGSEVLRDLTAVQQDDLLLRLAKKAGFSVFVTADTRFHMPAAPSLRVIVIDAGENAPSLSFLRSVASHLDEHIALIEQQEGQGASAKPILIRNKAYVPKPDAPDTPAVAAESDEPSSRPKPSRLASAKLRPSRTFER